MSGSSFRIDPAYPSASEDPPTALSGSRSSGHPRGSGRSLGPQYLLEFAPLFAHSPQMKAIRKILEEVAFVDATVLVRGESGVGKDVVARAIHAASLRHLGPFVKVNCAALPAELLESELFGHEKGAFTGAYRRKLGKFEFANKGTICLDEIGEVPRGLQPKLLHVLQDLQFSRIGGREIIHVDVRVVATTNRDLEAAIRSGDFREDLYYRLNVVEIWVPPLRERKEAIPDLSAYFLRRFNEQYDRNVEIPTEARELLLEYSWPGNIRELENTIRRLVVLQNPGQIYNELINRINATDRMHAGSSRAEGTHAVPSAVAGELGGLKAIARAAARDAERRALVEVLERVRWNRAEAARILKVSYKTLLNKLVECGIPSRRSQRSP